MSKRTTDIVAYLTGVGLLIAFLAGDRKNSRFHLNQALVLFLAGIIWNVVYRILRVVVKVLTFGLLTGVVGAVNAIVTLLLLVLFILGLVSAIKGEEKPVPILGGIDLYR